MPFRSEAEQVREQIRRLEEQAGDLLEEQADLERQVRLRGRGPVWIVGFVLAILATTAVGYAAGGIESTTSRVTRGTVEWQNEQGLGHLRTAQDDCEASRESQRVNFTACKREIGEPVPPAVPVTVSPPCRCQRGDPLCDCPFDRDMAAAALVAAEPSISGCIKPLRAMSLNAKLVFDSSIGDVVVASIDPPIDLSDVERRCVVTILRGVKVPPFGDGRVTVGRTYTVRGPR